MSERSMSTPLHRLTAGVFVRMTAISIALTATILLATFGPEGLGRRAVALAKASGPHAPRLDLLAHASLAIQLHVLAVIAALIIGLVLLAGVKGTRQHRTLGWGWVAFMGVGATASLFIRQTGHGGLSLLHLFTALTFVSLPVGVIAARRHNVRLHGRTMTGLFTGGLIVAGATAFLPGRLMWRMFFG